MQRLWDETFVLLVSSVEVSDVWNDLRPRPRTHEIGDFLLVVSKQLHSLFELLPLLMGPFRESKWVWLFSLLCLLSVGNYLCHFPCSNVNRNFRPTRPISFIALSESSFLSGRPNPISISICFIWPAFNGAISNLRSSLRLYSSLGSKVCRCFVLRACLAFGVLFHSVSVSTILA